MALGDEWAQELVARCEKGDFSAAEVDQRCAFGLELADGLGEGADLFGGETGWREEG